MADVVRTYVFKHRQLEKCDATKQLSWGNRYQGDLWKAILASKVSAVRQA